jgi:ribosome-binding protein aMBF1 (putative translation factor)
MNHQNWESVTITKTNPNAPTIVKTKIAKQHINKNLTTVKCEKLYDQTEPGAEPEIKPIMVTHEFGKQIASTRLEKNLTQKQLANQLSIPHNIISQYEKGKGVYNINYVNKIKRFINN